MRYLLRALVGLALVGLAGCAGTGPAVVRPLRLASAADATLLRAECTPVALRRAPDVAALDVAARRLGVDVAQVLHLERGELAARLWDCPERLGGLSAAPAGGAGAVQR